MDPLTVIQNKLSVRDSVVLLLLKNALSNRLHLLATMTRLFGCAKKGSYASTGEISAQHNEPPQQRKQPENIAVVSARYLGFFNNQATPSG
jgi:hypothetical protein